MPKRLRRHLLALREQRLHLAEVEQRVSPFLLLDDAGDHVALAAGELLVGHLALRVAKLLEDHLLRRLGADPSLEVVGDLDLGLRDHLHLETGLVAPLDRRGVHLLELLLPHAKVARLGIDHGAEPDELVVPLGMFLLPVSLVRRGHRFLEPAQDGLERDPLLPLELP